MTILIRIIDYIGRYSVVILTIILGLIFQGLLGIVWVNSHDSQMADAV